MFKNSKGNSKKKENGKNIKRGIPQTETDIKMPDVKPPKQDNEKK